MNHLESPGLHIQGSRHHLTSTPTDRSSFAIEITQRLAHPTGSLRNTAFSKMTWSDRLHVSAMVTDVDDVNSGILRFMRRASPLRL